MARVNQACNDASNLKMMAGLIPVFLTLAVVMRLLGMVAELAVFSALGAAIRWRLRFAVIQTDDPDFGRARRIAMIALWSCAPLAAIMVAIRISIMAALKR